MLQDRSSWTGPSVYCTLNTQCNNHDCSFNTQSSYHDCTFNTQCSNQGCTFNIQNSNHDCTFTTRTVVTMLVSYFNFHSFQNMMKEKVFRVNASNHECLLRITLPEHLSSTTVFGGVHVTRSFVLCVCFVDRCLSFCPFSFGICDVCSSSIYGFWLPLWYLWYAKSNEVLNII